MPAELSFADMRGAAVRCWTAGCDVVTSLLAGVTTGHLVSRQWLPATYCIIGVLVSLIVRRILRRRLFQRFTEVVEERLARSPENLDATLHGTGSQSFTAENRVQIERFRSQVRGIFLLRHPGFSWAAIILVGAITAALVYESWRRWSTPEGPLPYSPYLIGVIDPPKNGKPPTLNAEAAARLAHLLELEHAGWWILGENRCFKTRVTQAELIAAIKNPSDLETPAKDFLALAEKRMAGWLDAAAALDTSLRAVNSLKPKAVRDVRDQLDPAMASANQFTRACSDFRAGPSLDKREKIETSLAHFNSSIDSLATALQPLLKEVDKLLDDFSGDQGDVKPGDPCHYQDKVSPAGSAPDDPKQGDPAPGDPKQGDPKQGDPKQGDPKQGDPKQGDPKQGNPKQGDPKQGDPKQGDPKQGDPKQGDPKQGDPKQGDPKQGDPKQGDPKQGDPKQGDPKQGDPKQGDPKQGSPSPSQNPSDGSSSDQNGSPDRNSEHTGPHASSSRSSETVTRYRQRAGQPGGVVSPETRASIEDDVSQGITVADVPPEQLEKENSPSPVPPSSLPDHPMPGRPPAEPKDVNEGKKVDPVNGKESGKGNAGKASRLPVTK